MHVLPPACKSLRPATPSGRRRCSSGGPQLGFRRPSGKGPCGQRQQYCSKNCAHRRCPPNIPTLYRPPTDPSPTDTPSKRREATLHRPSIPPPTLEKMALVTIRRDLEVTKSRDRVDLIYFVTSRSRPICSTSKSCRIVASANRVTSRLFLCVRVLFIDLTTRICRGRGGTGSWSGHSCGGGADGSAAACGAGTPSVRARHYCVPYIYVFVCGFVCVHVFLCMCVCARAFVCAPPHPTPQRTAPHHTYCEAPLGLILVAPFPFLTSSSSGVRKRQWRCRGAGTFATSGHKCWSGPAALCLVP